MMLAVAMLLGSCKKFVELGAPTDRIGVDEAFTSDITATSAIVGLYQNGYAGSFIVPFNTYAGMSADDVQYATPSSSYDEFENNAVTTSNSLLANNLWYYPYSQIAQCNIAINGLNSSSALTPAVKNQLLGEAKFWRAFVFFHLVNYFGDVPLALDPNPFNNAALPRSPAADVWKQIIADLKDAQTLLTDAYPSSLRARVNRGAATALLARCYLYTKDWDNAVTESSKLIGNSTYKLEKDLNSVFINTSNEVIWQLFNTTGVSLGSSYLAATGVVPAYILYDTLYRSFSPADLRLKNWTGTVTLAGSNYRTVNKYKLRVAPAGGTGNEYTVVLRLAEQYLIRAEALANKNSIAQSVADVDSIRARAGLPLLSNSISQSDLLLAIEQERKLELFGEWGHRWFDLKRTPSLLNQGQTRADDVLKGIKPAWKPTAILYPIPDAQRTANPNLTQNAGY